MSTFSFSLAAPGSLLGPRTGSLTVRNIRIETPGLAVSTSRGVIPHLSRDQHKRAPAIRWIHIPFETCTLENNPPVPTLQPGKNPLHRFLGYSVEHHVLALCLRDPADGKKMPANGNDYVSASSAHGVKKVNPAQWRSYVRACSPDIVKRNTKSIDRTATWLANLLSPDGSAPPLNILVHMAGGTSIPARRAFTESLNETLHGREAESVRPFRCLNDGVVGYIFDLLPIRMALHASAGSAATPENHTASLAKCSSDKLRVVNSVASPHEILQLTYCVGIDIFDAKWAQDAPTSAWPLTSCSQSPRMYHRPPGKEKRDLGHNLYLAQYAHDLSSVLRLFHRWCSSSDRVGCGRLSLRCLCRHAHRRRNGFLPPFTRAYLHHLLNTHEMSAHSLLAMHNLAVIDAFLAGIRAVLHDNGADFGAELDRFFAEYDESMRIFDEARTMCKDVDVARGKGRLAREKALNVVLDKAGD
ncbi:tRNA-guanine(15) transglycosylase-like protein [Mycena sp. CBHHK59/15]|nr:tRNA-guanine(15) transglycosylase-like protein [Mycena sp. CBHHK59/15]